jgi:hypothetical protein
VLSVRCPPGGRCSAPQHTPALCVPCLHAAAWGRPLAGSTHVAADVDEAAAHILVPDPVLAADVPRHAAAAGGSHSADKLAGFWYGELSKHGGYGYDGHYWCGSGPHGSTAVTHAPAPRAHVNTSRWALPLPGQPAGMARCTRRRHHRRHHALISQRCLHLLSTSTAAALPLAAAQLPAAEAAAAPGATTPPLACTARLAAHQAPSAAAAAAAAAVSSTRLAAMATHPTPLVAMVAARRRTCGAQGRVWLQRSQRRHRVRHLLRSMRRRRQRPDRRARRGLASSCCWSMRR